MPIFQLIKIKLSQNIDNLSSIWWNFEALVKASRLQQQKRESRWATRP
jgi:hypothetical protein